MGQLIQLQNDENNFDIYVSQLKNLCKEDLPSINSLIFE